MTFRFTTLVPVVERIQEAEYFIAAMNRSDGPTFTFNLNAFLSASRSVTFVLQSAMSGSCAFEAWYQDCQERMKADEEMTYFVQLRNISQKRGPVACIGGGLPGGGWTYRFAVNDGRLPIGLLGRDLVECCADQLAKIATYVAEFYDTFPHHACVWRAFSSDGQRELGFSVADALAAVGLPETWADCAPPGSDVLSYLRKEIEAVDRPYLTKVSSKRLFDQGVPIEFRYPSGSDLVDDIVSTVGRKKY